MIGLQYVWNPERTGNILRSLRAKTGKTAEQVADDIGVSRQTVYAYETGDKTPTPANMALLATYYQVSLEELFFELIRVDTGGNDFALKYEPK